MLSLLHHLIDPRRLHGTAVLLVACLIAAGCAGTSALRRGESAERRQEYDSAVVGEMRRASSTMRNRSIVSLRSALLR